ncbi:alpha/beta hydrolase family protein [Nocardia sp. NPDC051570]|uniref:alpha/beta hydrolase family protein n=1 Tax=Nocardia sp. NPDC051570 TaxID=3364324 RepID=UPI0037960700
MARLGVIISSVDAPAGDFTVRPELDLNHDGKLDVNLEFRPATEDYLDRALQPGGFYEIYGPGRALPTVLDQAPKLSKPVLVLQGSNDANVPAAGAVALDTALFVIGNRDHTLHQFPGLGHSLGRTATVLTDDFQLIDQTALDTLGEWLDAHVQSG